MDYIILFFQNVGTMLANASQYCLDIVPQLWIGAKFTLSLFFITLVLSIPLGLLLALMRLSKFKLFNYFVSGYVWLMRGTPLMLQIFFIYYALPALGISFEAFATAVVAFVLNYAAYFAEIFRSGIQGVNKGQYEAAKTLGMSYSQMMRRVVLPQMVKKILPPLSNETITLVKDTSLVYVIAIQDLIFTAFKIIKREFNLYPFLIAGIFYLIMTLILTLIYQKLEKHYARYDE